VVDFPMLLGIDEGLGAAFTVLFWIKMKKI